MFQFQTKDLDTVKKMADKYGILYSILPDLNAADGMSEILFHSQAAPRIQSIMEQIQHSKIGSMDDYFTNAEPEELEQVVQEAEKKSAIPKEKEYRTVANEFVRNPGTRISDIRSRLDMTWAQIWPIIKHMEANGLAEHGKDGTVTMAMDEEQFQNFVDSDQWREWFGKQADRQRDTGQGVSGEKLEEIQRIQKQYRENPKANGITIDRKMVMEETERSIKTRIPYKRDEYIWLRKSEITWINGNKTIYANLKKEKTYQVLDSENRPVRRVSGKDLYVQSYAPVDRDRMHLEQDRTKKRQQKEKQYKRNQKALEDVRKAMQGRGSR